jgi:hypothetical protein
LEKQVIWQHPKQGIILMSLKWGGPRGKRAVATWNFETISAFA